MPGLQNIPRQAMQLPQMGNQQQRQPVEAQQQGSANWPERPVYKPPSNRINWKKVMGAAAQARLSMEEFGSLLSNLGVIDAQMRGKADRVYAHKLADYQDQLKQMETKNKAESEKVKKGAEILEKERRYQLDLEKGAREERESGRKEREFGLDIKKEQRETLTGERDFGLGLIKEGRLREEGRTKAKDGLTFTEKERYKGASKELAGLQAGFADPLSKIAGDPEAGKARAGELKDLLGGLESREAGQDTRAPAAGAEAAKLRQSAVVRTAEEIKTRFPSATPDQRKKLLGLKIGAYGEGEEAKRMWEQIIMELEGEPQAELVTGGTIAKRPPLGGGEPQYREPLSPQAMSGRAKDLPGKISEFFTRPRERQGWARQYGR